jgi:hypothetical protein
MPTVATAAADVRYGRMTEGRTETAENPIKKTAQVVLPTGSTSLFRHQLLAAERSPPVAV